MLNVPNSIKALYQRDGVRKNFRVHFPNGEYADITNDNVVQESVKFTESLSSQSTFKFGLAEASVLEFETVGVGNMFGMTIEASMEIDGSSLSAADKAAIAAGTWDGTWSDDVFGIPLGTFRVNSCPRDHQSMAHRQVTAYTLYGGGSAKNSPFEEAKLKLQEYPQKGEYTPDIVKLVLAAFGWLNEGTRNKLTKTQYASWSSLPNGSQTQPIWSSGGGASYIRLTNYAQKELDFSTIPEDALYSLELNGPMTTASSLETLGPIVDGLTWLTADDKAKVKRQLKKYLSIHLVNGFEWDSDMPIFYPYWNQYQYRLKLIVPMSCTVEFHGGGSTTTRSFTLISSTPTFSVFSGLPTAMQGSFASTGEFERSDSQKTETYIDAYDFANLATGYLEINGQFGKADRLGGFEVVELDNSSPMSVMPENYSSCWWDEYDVEPIGTVVYSYKDEEKKDNTLEYAFGDGASVYDMTSNEAVKALATADQATVQNLLDTLFIPKIGTATFTPVDLTMQGWPWLEAGDALEVEAEDGTIVKTYALRVEMSGIQHLQSAITAEGGEIIEEVS